MPRPVPCCVDVPAAEALVRYGLQELLRGLGLEPEWGRRDRAAIVVALEAEGPLGFDVSEQALADLDGRRTRPDGEMGVLEVEGERWPVPVGDGAGFGDAVAGAAWWLAGVQEAATAVRDRHGRFPYARSLQSRLGTAPGGPLRPAVDAVRRALEARLVAAGVGVERRTWDGRPWAVALTHDLDAVTTRRVRAGLGSLRRGRVLEAARRALGPDRRRASVLDLEAVSRRHGAGATWFVKPGAWTPHDVPGGLDPWVVGTLSAWRPRHEVGWHPGYGTAARPDRLATERGRFRAAFGADPALARTHFLRWAGRTPRDLVDAGVRVDSTLGFAEHHGFRRGTAHPFPVFDLEVGAATDLWEVPLAVMDTTLTGYLGLDAAAVGGALADAFAAAERSGGVAVVLWHNQVGGDTAGWAARLDALDRAVGHARARGAAVGPLGSLLASWNGGA